MAFDTKSPELHGNILKSEIKFKIGLLRALLITGFPFPIYYGAVAFLSGKLLNAALNGLICLIFLVGVVTSFRPVSVNKRLRHILLLSYAYLTSLALLHLWLIFSNSIDQFSWFVIFPLLAFIALGNRHGVFVTLIYILAVGLSLWLLRSSNEALISSQFLKIQTTICIITAAVISFINETVRKRTHERLFTEQEKLLRSEKALEQLNRDLELQVQRRTEKLYDSNIELTQEIKNRELSEKALQESEKKYRDLFENLSDFLFTHDMAGNFIETNLAVKSLFNATHTEDKKVSAGDLMSDAYAPEFKEYLQRIVSKGHDEGFFRFLNKDGVIRYAEYKNQLVTDSDGEPLFVRGAARDVTERIHGEREKKRLQQQLQQAKKFEALATLSGGIAHDFNNLLMGIQGRTSLIRMELGPYDPRKEHVEAIEEYIKSASNLTRQILGFARGGKYEIIPLDINALVATTAAMFGRTRKEIAIHDKTEPAPIIVQADKSLIEQAFLNFLINAWQAMPQGGNLYLETASVQLDQATCASLEIETGPYAHISVADTGVGIEADLIQRVFDPFFTTKEKGCGTGLGLASAYGIIKNHSGTITVSSEVGQGTVFNIYLPLSDEAVRREDPTNEELVKGVETILLVDDEEIILEVTTSMLEMLGYDVLVAQNGQGAIDAVGEKKNQIDLIILDMIMPGMGGGEVFTRIREIRPGIPVMLSSGYSLDGKTKEIMDRGCDAFVQKPFNISEMSQKIRRILDGKGDLA